MLLASAKYIAISNLQLKYDKDRNNEHKETTYELLNLARYMVSYTLYGVTC